MKRNASLLSNVIGGCIAGLIYFVIDVSTGGKFAAALGEAALLGVAVFAFAFAVSRTVIAVKQRRAHAP